MPGSSKLTAVHEPFERRIIGIAGWRQRQLFVCQPFREPLGILQITCIRFSPVDPLCRKRSIESEAGELADDLKEILEAR